MQRIPTKLTLENAVLPTRNTPYDAGLDLYLPNPLSIEPNGIGKVDFGVQMEIPEGYCGLLFARSGLGSRGITPRNCVGVIDSKYRGNIMVKLDNKIGGWVHFKRGERVAQLVIVPVNLMECVEVDELDMDGDRGGGFGSTGN